MATRQKTTVKVQINNAQLSQVLKFQKKNLLSGEAILLPILSSNDQSLRNSVLNRKVAKESILEYESNNELLTHSLINSVEVEDDTASSSNTVQNGQILEEDPLNITLVDADSIMETNWWDESVKALNTNPDYDVEEKVLAANTQNKNLSMGYMLLPINGNGITFADLISKAKWYINNAELQYMYAFDKSMSIQEMASLANSYKLVKPTMLEKLREFPNDGIEYKLLDYMEPITPYNLKKFKLKMDVDPGIKIWTTTKLNDNNIIWALDYEKLENVQRQLKCYFFKLPIFVTFYATSYYKKQNDAYQLVYPENNIMGEYPMYNMAYCLFAIEKNIYDNLNIFQPIPFRYIIHDNKKYVNSNNCLIKHNNTYQSIISNKNMLDIIEDGLNISYIIILDIIDNYNERIPTYLQLSIYVKCPANLRSLIYYFNNLTTYIKIKLTKNITGQTLYTLTNFILPEALYNDYDILLSNNQFSYNKNNSLSVQNICLLENENTPVLINMEDNKPRYIIARIVGYRNGEFSDKEKPTDGNKEQILRNIWIYRRKDRELPNNYFYDKIKEQRNTGIIFKGILYDNLFNKKILYEAPYTDIYDYAFAKENVLIRQAAIDENNTTHDNFLYSFEAYTLNNETQINNRLALYAFYEETNNLQLIAPISRIYWVPAYPNTSSADILYKIKYNINSDSTSNDDQFTYLIHKALKYQVIVGYNLNYTTNGRPVTNASSFLDFTKMCSNPTTKYGPESYYITCSYNPNNSINDYGKSIYYAFKPDIAFKSGVSYQSYDIIHKPSDAEYNDKDGGYYIEFRVLIYDGKYDVSFLAKLNWCLTVKLQYKESYNGYYNDTVFKIPLNTLKNVDAELKGKNNVLFKKIYAYDPIMRGPITTLENTQSDNGYINDSFVTHLLNFEKGNFFKDIAYMPTDKAPIVNNYKSYLTIMLKISGENDPAYYTTSVIFSKLLYNTDGTNNHCVIKVHVDYITASLNSTNLKYSRR